MPTNRGVKGRVIRAGSDPDSPEAGIKGLTVSAYDIDPITSDDHLGSATTLDDGSFEITYDPDKYRPFFLGAAGENPDIEVRIYGAGQRLLWETPRQDDVQVEKLSVGVIEIHPNNLRVDAEGESPESIEQRRQDKYWLATHTTLNPASGDAVRLTRGNQIEWLVDGAAMFPAITDDIVNATTSVRLMNMAFNAKELGSKFTFPGTKDHTNVTDADTVEVHRLGKILGQKAGAGVPVNVLVWDLADTGDPLGVLLFDVLKIFGKPDTADEVKAFFQNTSVKVDTLETSQLLHIKLVVVDGTTGYVIGSTMKQGYFGDDQHLLRDARHGGLIPDKNKSGRQLMHDVSLKVHGPALRFVDQTFATIWNVPPNVTTVTPAPQVPPIGGDAAPIGVQVLRTLPGEMFLSNAPNADTEHLPAGETGILESYQRAIMKAEEYIYIEDQYFSSPEIASAIRLRMDEKPDLEVILVLNVRPDIGGYHEKQTALINELRDALGDRTDRLGVFTMWSSDGSRTPFEIAHVYVHSKLAIIDDRWASVGTANLDGASLNQRQWGLILLGTLAELPPVQKALATLLTPVLIALLELTAAPLVLLAASAISFPTLMPFLVDTIRKEIARTTQHANPNRTKQPPRHSELNLVVYDGIAGQPPATTVGDLRKSLWREQLGGVPPAVKPSGGWLSHWRTVAEAYRTNIRAASEQPSAGAPTRTKILEWAPPRDYRENLRALGIKTENKDNIKVRDTGEKMRFKAVDVP